MRQSNKQPQFVKANNIVNRQKKIAALATIGTVDSRKERKHMNVHAYGKLSNTNTNGFYGKRHPVKIKVTAKTRRQLSAAKNIMRGLA